MEEEAKEKRKQSRIMIREDREVCIKNASGWADGWLFVGFLGGAEGSSSRNGGGCARELGELL